MAVSAPRPPDLLEQARARLGSELFEQIAEAVRALALVEDRRYLVGRREAARRLGVSLSHFQRHVQPHLRCVYSGQLRLYRPADLEGWAESAATNPERSR